LVGTLIYKFKLLTELCRYDNPEASSVLIHRKEVRAKRRKLMEEKAAETTGTTADDAAEGQNANSAPAPVPEGEPKS
jgi:hypothetical protein